MVDQNNNTTLQPFFDNITYSNITATGSSQNVAIIYGLNSIPASPTDPLRNIDSVSFHNVTLSGSYGADIYYTSNLNLSGLAITAANGNAINLFGDTLVLPGDYNSDGTVNGQDYDTWRANFGSQTSLAADGNGNGVVDGADYVMWRDHLGASLGSGWCKFSSDRGRARAGDRGNPSHRNHGDLLLPTCQGLKTFKPRHEQYPSQRPNRRHERRDVVQPVTRKLRSYRQQQERRHRECHCPRASDTGAHVVRGDRLACPVRSEHVTSFKTHQSVRHAEKRPL